MSFIDFLKRKEKKEKAGAAEKPRVEKKEEKKAAEIYRKPAERQAAGGAFRIVKNPRITEKAGFAERENKYIFDVFKNANKQEIKKAIAEIYGKTAEKVHIVNIPPKKKRHGRSEYLKPGIKKAVVTLKKGETIEIMPR